ncbi:CocE/NonD family hydrolase [Paraburkholderia dilworthii]|uniref:CocE/NonD family hydrolase n=1 Tax=Paraburkholderia dilworthii TaxID=948106 RepID=UPI001376B8F3|nr:CocE/NonD family hydrolase [Paraburkholderia dilworthii]
MCSPYHYLDQIPKDVPIYSVSGWYDGGGYSNGAITRFLTRANSNDRLLLGSWDHGARTFVSPWREQETPAFNLLAELPRFFDTHLLDRRTGQAEEAPIHYYNVHAEQWQSATTWPPVSQRTRLSLSAGNGLSETPSKPHVDVFKVDFETTSGKQTRCERLGAASIVDYYPDWQERSASMQHYHTAPLNGPASLEGHAVANLQLAIDQGDASIFVYLSEVEVEGNVFCITEGMLRAIHRKTSICDHLAVPLLSSSRCSARRSWRCNRVCNPAAARRLDSEET